MANGFSKQIQKRIGNAVDGTIFVNSDFAMKFYPRAWAKYQEAVPGTLKLVPPDYRFAALAADYEAMKDMLYGDVPIFETVMSTVGELEKEINAL